MHVCGGVQISPAQKAHLPAERTPPGVIPEQCKDGVLQDAPARHAAQMLVAAMRAGEVWEISDEVENRGVLHWQSSLRHVPLKRVQRRHCRNHMKFAGSALTC
jgi:hypothetical protein